MAKVNFKTIFIFLIAVIGVVMPLASRDVGVSNDEYTHAQHGKILLDYFEGRSQRAALPPFQADGKALPALDGSKMKSDDPSWATINVFGGLFDLICAFADRHLSSLGEYETRHVVNSFFGVFAILFIGLFAKELGGWRAGALGLLFGALSPRLFGHSMNNPKDLPFAALHIFCLYQTCLLLNELPKIKASRAGWLALGIALSIDIRISGLLSIAYLYLFVGLWASKKFWTNRETNFRAVARPFGYLALIGLTGYFGASLLWPWAHSNPLMVPLTALRFVSKFDLFRPLELFEGHWIGREDTPWYYLPKWTWITSPAFVTLGIFLIPTLFWNRKKRTGSNWLSFGLLVFAIIFPIIYIVIKKANVYDEARHVLFVVPPLLVLCAWTCENLIQILENERRSYAFGFAALLSLCAIEPFTWMVRNHPHENMYFSPLIGGIKGAFKKYEMDYWSTSHRQAVEWIQKNDQPVSSDHPIRIWVYYGDPFTADYYIKKKPGYKRVVTVEESLDWDYFILMTASTKYFPAMLANWPPVGTVYQVTADGVPLVAVLKNHRNLPEGMLAVARFAAEKDPSPAHFISLGMEYYQRKRFLEAIEAFKKAIELNPKDAIAYNNVGATYGALRNWEEEVRFARKALEVDPNFELAQNNLNFALQQNSKAPSRAKASDNPIGESGEK